MIRLFDDAEYAFQALCALGEAGLGGGETGEVLAARGQVKEGDDESWYAAWISTSDRVEAAAAEFESGGDPISAQECHYRASMYYRSAEFFIHADPKAPRVNET